MWNTKPAAAKNRNTRQHRPTRRWSIIAISALAIVGLIGTSASALTVIGGDGWGW